MSNDSRDLDVFYQHLSENGGFSALYVPDEGIVNSVTESRGHLDLQFPDDIEADRYVLIGGRSGDDLNDPFFQSYYIKVTSNPKIK